MRDNFRKIIVFTKLIIDFGIHLYYKKDKYRPSPDCIEIDITSACNLKCYNCNRSCRQAPADEYITVGQIKKFIGESIEQKRRWRRIRLMGGEPALHPDLIRIIRLLIDYKRQFSPSTLIALTTNGCGKEVKDVLFKIKNMVKIENMHKDSAVQYFYAFNEAPVDFVQFKNADFSRGCDVTQLCGIGLNRYGYYPCGVSGGIDRVFGFDCGRKKLPAQDDIMRDQFQKICRYCGIFKWDYKTLIYKKEAISTSWETAYKKFEAKSPKLTLY